MSIGIVYALVAAIGYSFRSLLYKMVERHGFDRNLFLLSYRIFSIPISLFILKLSDAQSLFLDFKSNVFSLIIIVVLISYIADSLYFYGFSRIEMTLSSIFSRVAPVFSLIVSFLLLHEMPKSIAVFGIILIVAVSIWVAKSMVSKAKTQNEGRGVIAFIVGNMLYTLNGTLISQIYAVSGGMSFVFFFSLLTCGIYLVSSIKDGSFSKLKGKNVKQYLLLFTLNFVAIISFFSNVEAFGTILVPVAYALTSFGFIFTFLLSYIFLGERENLIKKIIATFGMLIGGFLTIS
ncbi:MAG: EamA family transporter [Patescibacteria group bacterium]